MPSTRRGKRIYTPRRSPRLIGLNAGCRRRLNFWKRLFVVPVHLGRGYGRNAANVSDTKARTPQSVNARPRLVHYTLFDLDRKAVPMSPPKQTLAQVHACRCPFTRGGKAGPRRCRLAAIVERWERRTSRKSRPDSVRVAPVRRTPRAVHPQRQGRVAITHGQTDPPPNDDGEPPACQWRART